MTVRNHKIGCDFMAEYQKLKKKKILLDILI